MTDKQIISELARKAGEIAALPVQEKRLRQWKALNARKPERPMFTIDQICWGQMTYNDELTLQCEDEFARNLELELRRRLYRWNHLRDDRVFEPYLELRKVIGGGAYSIPISETTLSTGETNAAKSHHYNDQLSTVEELENFTMTDIEYDPKATNEQISRAENLVDGFLEVRSVGRVVGFAIWDRITQFRGVDKILYDIIDRPGFIHATVDKFVQLSARLIDQLEEHGLLYPAQPLIHCAGAWTDELPKAGFDPEKPRACDCWTSGMAQALATVSPEMHDEFEIQHVVPLYERFGLVNYGCCEPLDRKIHIVKKIKNIRKLSISPWADQQLAAEQIGKDYVFLRKPNPAHLATDIDETLVRNHLLESIEICEKNDAVLEYALKDLSTVNNKPQNLWRWCEIARDVVGD